MSITLRPNAQGSYRAFSEVPNSGVVFADNFEAGWFSQYGWTMGAPVIQHQSVHTGYFAMSTLNSGDSAWVILPSTYQSLHARCTFMFPTLPVAGNYVHVMSFTENTVWADIATVRVGVEPDGTSRVVIESGGYGNAWWVSPNPVTLVAGVFHTLELYASIAVNGAVEALLDGVPVLSIPSYNTSGWSPIGGINTFRVGNGYSPSPVSMFVDDVVVSTLPIGVMPTNMSNYLNDQNDDTALQVVDSEGESVRFPTSPNTESISSLELHMRAKASVAGLQAKQSLITSGSWHDGAPITIGETGFADYATTFVRNPQTNAPWTWADINALEMGAFGISIGANQNIKVSEMYAIVNLGVAPPSTITLNVVAGANGSVSPAGVQTLNIGQSYTFTASPSANYYLSYWDLGGTYVGTSPTLVLTAESSMDGKTLTALFTTTPPSPPTNLVPPDGYCYHSAFICLVDPRTGNLPVNATECINAINYFVNVTGKNIYLYNNQAGLCMTEELWMCTPTANWSDSFARAIEQGYIKAQMITLSPMLRAQASTDTWTVQQIIAGDYDPYLTTIAQQAKAFAYPLFIRFGPEMNICDGASPWYHSYAYGTSAPDYVGAFRHVVDLFRAQGVTNVQWVWNPNMNSLSQNWTVNDYYPGDNYVDWVGIDMYQFYPNDDPASQMAEVYNLYSSRKPIIILEYGINQNANSTDAQSATYLTNFFNAVESRIPIKMVCYQFDIGWHAFDMQTKPLSTTVYRDRIANSRYISLPYGSSVTLTITSTSGGTTSPTGSQNYDAGTIVPVTATPSTGFHFVKWLLDGVDAGTSTLISVTMNVNHALQAVFTANVTYTLTVQTNVVGGPTGTQTVVEGTILQVLASPVYGYSFDHWTLDGANAGTLNPINVTMNANHILVAVYSLLAVTLNVMAGTGGSVSPSGPQTLTVGQSYQFNATEATGYNFDHWDLSGENKGSSPSIILNITATMDGKTLTALFATEPPPQITMTLAVAGNGSTDIASGSHQFNVGDVVAITAIPQSGAIFIGWKLDGADYSTDNPLQLTITADLNGKTLTADFTMPTQAGFPWWALVVVVPVTLIGGYALKGTGKKKPRR